MIYQSGYLTIKDWNMDTDSYPVSYTHLILRLDKLFPRSLDGIGVRLEVHRGA